MTSKPTSVSQPAGPPRHLRTKRHLVFAAVVVCLALSVMIIPALASVSAAPLGAAPQENGTPPWIPTIPTIPTEQISSWAKITIVKDAQPDSGDDFEFYGALGVHFALDDITQDDNDIYPKSLTIYVPPASLPGSYNFSEVSQADWELTSINCDQPGKVTTDLSQNKVSISVVAGDHVTCTFVNVSTTNPPTSTATDTATNTPTHTPSDTPTNTATPTPTNTSTATATNTPVTPTDTPTATNTATATNTPVTPTNTATRTPVGPTNTATVTPPGPTNTATKTPTNTATNTPVNTATKTPTNTATNTPTRTVTNTPVPPTNTPTRTATNTPLPPTNTATNTPTNTPATPTNTPIAVPTLPTPLPGKALIVIKKDAQPNSKQNFRFDGAFGGFTLDDASPDDGDQYSNTILYNVDSGGTYNFSERTPSEWYLAAINCSGGSTTVNMEQRSVSIKPKTGETIVCTFVNQRRVQIQVRKYYDTNENGLHQSNESYLPSWSIELYSIGNTWITNRITDDDGAVFYSLRRPGGYKICEMQKKDWYNTSPGIDDASLHLPCYTVMIPPGQGVSMLFGNHPGSKPSDGNTPGVSDGELIFYTLPDVDDPNTSDPEVNQDRQVFYLPSVKR